MIGVRQNAALNNNVLVQATNRGSAAGNGINPNATAVIGAPIVVFLFFTLTRLLSGLRRLTGLTDKELLLPR